jgi:hypothetical protein
MILGTESWGFAIFREDRASYLVRVTRNCMLLDGYNN